MSTIFQKLSTLCMVIAIISTVCLNRMNRAEDFSRETELFCLFVPLILAFLTVILRLLAMELQKEHNAMLRHFVELEKQIEELQRK